MIGFPELATAGEVAHHVQVTLTQGRLGMEMLLEASTKAMYCHVSFANSGQIKGELSVRFDQIALWRVGDLYKLRGLAQLLKSMMSRSTLRLQLIAHPTVVDPIELRWGENVPSIVEQVRRELEALEALEYIHRVLGVPSVECQMNNFVATENQEWLEAAALLRGERVQMKLVRMRADADFAEGQVPVTSEGNFRSSGGIWGIPFQGTCIAEFPVDTHYVRYRVVFESIEADGKIQALLEPMDELSERYVTRTADPKAERLSTRPAYGLGGGVIPERRSEGQGSSNTGYSQETPSKQGLTTATSGLRTTNTH